MTTPEITIKTEASATFNYRFFGWLDAVARRWVNPDGSEGGIVAVDATIDAKITLSVDVVVGPRASIGDGASIGGGASIGYGASIGDGASIGPRASIGYGASIGPRASIGDGASIGYGDWYTTIGPIGSRNAMSTAAYSKQHGLRWWVGCQHGISTDQLLGRVETEHGDSPHGDDYRAAIAYVTTHPGLIRAQASKEQPT